MFWADHGQGVDPSGSMFGTLPPHALDGPFHTLAGSAAGKVLRATGATTFALSTTIWPNAVTAGNLLYASATDTLTGLPAGTAGALLYQGVVNPTWSTVSGGLQWDAANGYLGIGVTSPAQTLDLSSAYNATSGTYGGVYSVVSCTPVGASTANISALYGEIAWHGNTTSASTAANGLRVVVSADHVLGVTLGNLVGLQFNVSTSAAGNTTSLYGVRVANLRNSGSGVVATAYGTAIFDAANSGAGSITTLYGLYIAQQTAGASANYSIWVNGGESYFGGQVDVKAASKLTLDGTTGADYLIRDATNQVSVFVNSAINQRWTTKGTVIGGTTALGTSAVATLGLMSGTAPTTSPADMVQLWEADRGGTAGKGSLHLRTEDGTSHVLGDLTGIGTLTPTARLEVTEATVGNEVFAVVSTATNDDPRWSLYQQRLATTDATATTLFTVAITASKTYMLRAHVAGRRTGGTAGAADDGAVYVRTVAYTTKGGVVTILGAVATDFTAEDQAAWDVTFVVSGTNVLIKCTGAANNNITWHGHLYLASVGT